MKKMNLSRRHLLSVIIMLICGFLLYEGVSSAFGQVNWESDLNVGMRKAQQTNRLILIHVYGESCPPCKAMDASVFPDRRVISELNEHFIAIKINSGKSPEIARGLNVRGIPADIIMHPNGSIVHKREGGISADRFVAYLVKVRSVTTLATENVPMEEARQVQNLVIQPPVPQSQVVFSSLAYQMPAAPVFPPPANAPVCGNGQVSYVIPENAHALQQNKMLAFTGQSNEYLLALEGYCPVTLKVTEQWKIGSPEFSVMYQGIMYRFLDNTRLELFKADPDKYIPAMRGDDIVAAVDKGKKVAGKRQFGIWFKERIFLFSNQESLEIFCANPDYYFMRGVHPGFTTLFTRPQWTNGLVN